jgi:hypothetical protein
VPSSPVSCRHCWVGCQYLQRPRPPLASSSRAACGSWAGLGGATCGLPASENCLHSGHALMLEGWCWYGCMGGQACGKLLDRGSCCQRHRRCVAAPVLRRCPGSSSGSSTSNRRGPSTLGRFIPGRLDTPSEGGQGVPCGILQHPPGRCVVENPGASWANLGNLKPPCCVQRR